MQCWVVLCWLACFLNSYICICTCIRSAIIPCNQKAFLGKIVHFTHFLNCFTRRFLKKHQSKATGSICIPFQFSMISNQHCFLFSSASHVCQRFIWNAKFLPLLFVCKTIVYNYSFCTKMDASQDDNGNEKYPSPRSTRRSTSSRRMTLTLPLERLRNVLHRNHSSSSSDSKSKPKRNLVPPEIALNDSKLSPASREKTVPLSRPFARRKKFLKACNAEAGTLHQPNQFLTVDNSQGSQRKRSSSMNIDDRFALTSMLSIKGKTSSSSLSTVQNLHKPFLGVTKSLNSKSCEVIRNFLLTRESSPFHKLYFTTFLGAHRSEVLIPATSKVIVLDSKLTISKAFLALFHNNIRAAPVWSSRTMRYESMLTVTDFIRVLLDKYQMALDVNFEKFSKIKIGSWKKVSQY